MGDGSGSHVLVVTDDDAVSGRVSDALTEVDTTTVSDASAALGRLDGVDCVVTDGRLPDATGVELLAAVRERHPLLGVVVLSDADGFADEATAGSVTARVPPDDVNGALADRVSDLVERSRAERNAELVRRQLDAVADAVSDVIVTMDEAGSVVYANDAVRDVLGRSPDDAVGEPLTDLMPERFADRHAAAMERYRRTGERSIDWSSVPLVAERADGTEVDVDVSFTEYEIDGEPYYTGVLRERPSSRFAGAEVLERMTDAFIALDREFRLAHVNGRTESLLSVDAPAVLGRRAFDALSALADTAFETELRRAMREQSVVRFVEHVDALDALFAVRAYPSETGLTVFFDDVTAEAAHSGGELLERVLDVVPVGIVVYGPNDDVVRANDRASDIVSLPRERFDESFPPSLADALSTPEGDPIPAEERVYRRVISEGETIEDEIVEYETPDGGAVTLSVSGAPLRGAGGDTLGAVVAFEDVTELERKNERLDAFASVVSHDLRTPLAVASGALDLLEADTGHPEVDRAADALERIDTIVSDVLTLAREGETSLTPEPVSLADAACRAWGTLDASRATLDVDGDRTIVADADRLVRGLENVFRNALEHGGDGVAVRVDACDSGFRVTDDGPGIPAAERERVLEFGYTTRSSGTGLGLAIVNDIARVHGWSVSIGESERGGAAVAFRGVETA